MASRSRLQTPHVMRHPGAPIRRDRTKRWPRQLRGATQAEPSRDVRLALEKRHNQRVTARAHANATILSRNPLPESRPRREAPCGCASQRAADIANTEGGSFSTMRGFQSTPPRRQYRFQQHLRAAATAASVAATSASVAATTASVAVTTALNRRHRRFSRRHRRSSHRRRRYRHSSRRRGRNGYPAVPVRRRFRSPPLRTFSAQQRPEEPPPRRRQ